MALKRLQAELRDLKNKTDYPFSVGPVSEDKWFEWRAYMAGPKDSPFDGGTFEIEIKYPTDYPFKPPKVKFCTKVFHPNISKHGEICVDILQGEWSPAITTAKLLLSISSLLANPNAMDPLSPEAAGMYNTNIQEYNKIVREYTQKYAM